MNGLNKFLTATFLSAAVLLTSAAQDKGTKVGAVVTEKDKGTHTILDALKD